MSIDFANWKFGLTVAFYVLLGIEKLIGDISPDLASLGTPDAAISIGSKVLAGAIDTLSVIAVSVLGLSALVRPGVAAKEEA